MKRHFLIKEGLVVNEYTYYYQGGYANNQNEDGFFHGGGGSRVPHTYSEKWFFLKPFRIIPWLLLKRVLHLVWVSYYVYIVVEVTLNMAKLLGPSVTSISNHLEFPFWFFEPFPNDVVWWRWRWWCCWAWPVIPQLPWHLLRPGKHSILHITAS